MKKQIGRLIFVLILGLTLSTSVSRNIFQFPSNLAAMPVTGTDYYDNPAEYDATNSDHPGAVLVETITTQAVADGLPGVIMLVNTPENGTWVSAKGSIDLKNHVPLKANSLSRIGSITKMFTAVVIHQLAQEGKLTLDDPVSKFLPESVTRGIENADRATIRQLLRHTSGINNYTGHFDVQALYRSGSNRDLTSAKALDIVRGLPASFAPSTGCSYSNTNYILLGLIAEQVSGMAMKDLYQERIFTPLGLKSTYYDPDIPVQRGVARGYVNFPAGNLIDVTDFDQATRTPDGGIVSNVYDLATFIQALVRDRRLLSEAEFTEMTSNLEIDARLGLYNGLGILVYALSLEDYAYGHSGGHFGYSAELWYVPSRKLTLVYLTNGSSVIGTHLQPLAELKQKFTAMFFDDWNEVLKE